MTTKKALLSALKTTIVELITEIQDTIFVKHEEKDDMIIVGFFFKKLTETELMDHTIKHILPHKTMILEHNENFFITEKGTIFAGLPQAKIEYFADVCKKPYKEGGLSDHNKAMLWQYFETILKITERYKKIE
jgi:hypothetical protein